MRVSQKFELLHHVAKSAKKSMPAAEFDIV